MGVHKMKNYMIALLFMLICTGINAKEWELKKKPVLVNENVKESLMRAANSMILKSDLLGVLDHFGNRVKLFKIINDKMIFLRNIGSIGKGPGDINRPMSISIDNNKIAIRDSEGASFFMLNGEFLSKFRLFSKTISASYSGGVFYQLSVNQDFKNLIFLYSENGRRKGEIFPKYLKNDISKNKKIDITTAEGFFYRGKIFIEKNCIYYLNIMFGTLIKLDLSGKKLAYVSLEQALDKQSVSYIKENYEMLENGIKADFPKDGGMRIPFGTICEDACVFEKKLYLLTQDIKSDEGCIRSFDLKTMKPGDLYKFNIGHEDRIKSFAVGEDEDAMYFLIALEIEGDLNFIKCSKKEKSVNSEN